MKKQFLLFLALLPAFTGIFARQPSVLSALLNKIQYAPADTAAWSALHTWFDTTAMPAEQLRLELEKSLETIPLENNSRLRAELLRQSGISSMDRGEYQQSSEQLMQAIRLFESVGDARGMANTQVNLGALNYYLNQFDAAIRYWKQAAGFFEKHGPPAWLGKVYSNIGSVFSETNRLDSAESYHRRALRIHKQSHNPGGMAQAWNNLGVTLEYAKRFTESLDCYRKARALCDSIGDPAGAIRAMLNGATILEYQHQYSDALAANQEALERLKQCREKALYRLAYLNLAGLYSKTGHYKDAYESLEKYHIYKDSLVNDENTRFIQDMQIRYETEKKEQEIALLNRESETQALRLEQQRFVLAGLLAAAILLGALVWTVRRHQRRTDELLHNILPVAVATELRHTGRVLPKRHEAVTVLFADLVGFTELGHTLPPEILVGLIDRYYQAFDKIIGHYGIEKIKTIGDSYMCASGLPENHPQHAFLMYQAASDMLAWAHQNATFPDGQPHLQLRIGMHSGPVVAGIAGKTKYAYDIWGDTVNTAARMEQFGVPGRINLSEATRQLLGDAVAATPREPVEVKGIGWVRMYLVEYDGPPGPSKLHGVALTDLEVRPTLLRSTPAVPLPTTSHLHRPR